MKSVRASKPAKPKKKGTNGSDYVGNRQKSIRSRFYNYFIVAIGINYLLVRVKLGFEVKYYYKIFILRNVI